MHAYDNFAIRRREVARPEVGAERLPVVGERFSLRVLHHDRHLQPRHGSACDEEPRPKRRPSPLEPASQRYRRLADNARTNQVAFLVDLNLDRCRT